MDYAPPPSSQAAFYTALAALQAQLTPATTIEQALALLPAHRLTWYLRSGNREDCHELWLCHAEGNCLVSYSEPGASLRVVLAGLIGLPALLLGPADPVADAREQQVAEHQGAPPAEPAAPAPAPAAVEAAAARLAEATDGTVVEDAELVHPSDSHEPLSEADRDTTVDLVKTMTPETRKMFTIAFRDAFNVPREARAVAPLITQERHRQFVVRFVNEAEGVPAP